MVTQRGRFAIQPRFIWLLLLVLSVALFYTYQNRKIELDQQEEELRALHQEFYDESLRSDTLRTTLSQVNTERYIEQQARKEFGYLMADEIRFVLEEDPAEAQGQVPVPQASATAVPVATQAPVQQEGAQAASPDPQAAQESGEKDWSNVFN